MTETSIDVVEQVEELGVHYSNIASSEVAQKTVELAQRVALVAVTYTVSDVYLFIGMEVTER